MVKKVEKRDFMAKSKNRVKSPKIQKVQAKNTKKQKKSTIHKNEPKTAAKSKNSAKVTIRIVQEDGKEIVKKHTINQYPSDLYMINHTNLFEALIYPMPKEKFFKEVYNKQAMVV